MMNSVDKCFHNLRHVIPDSHPDLPLDVLLALDRMVVEVSMQLYNVNSRDRTRMRRQYRKLHAAVKRHFPRLRKARGEL